MPTSHCRKVAFDEKALIDDVPSEMGKIRRMRRRTMLWSESELTNMLCDKLSYKATYRRYYQSSVIVHGISVRP